MVQEGKEFQAALADFMHDFASGGAIRRLADLGLSVTEITERLSFPTPKDRVARTVWKHYLEKGIILLEEPSEDAVLQTVKYVKEQGPYGRVSMRRVTVEVPGPKAEYVPCEFGRKRYQDPEGFQRELKVLTEKERQYLLDLPWPLQTVWHIRDDRMAEIMKKLEGGENK